MYFLREIDNNEQFDLIIESIPDEIITDMMTIKKHWQKLRIPAINAVQTKLYDLYLKGNKIPSGVKNYQGVVEMICNYQSTATINL